MTYKRLQPEYIRLETVDSTNSFALSYLKNGLPKNGTTVIAKQQTSGRGQRGSSWQSDEGANLLMSVILFPNLKTNLSFYLNVIASLSVVSVLRDAGIRSQIKWPNDIMVGRIKLAGILIENQIQGNLIGSSVLGLGLNVNQTSFDMEYQATSIAKETGKALEVEDVCQQFLQYLDFYFDLLQKGELTLLRKEYHNHLFGYRETIRATLGEETGEYELQGIDEEGLLLLKKDGIVHKYMRGDIRLEAYLP